jgi:hypothetical protein
MTEIRRKILHQMYRNPNIRKAIAFSLFVKSQVVSSTVQEWTINKMHTITGVSALAIRDRLRTLRELDLIEEIGIEKKHLVFKSLKSHTSHRNVSIPLVSFETNNKIKKNDKAQNIKQIENTLSVMLVIEIQNHKNFAKRMIRQKRNPNNLDSLKDALKACNRYAYNDKFCENGISYKYIAKQLGVGLQKAFDIVSYAIKNQILSKKKNVQKKYISCIKYIQDMIKPNYTYIKSNFIFKIKANSYAIIAGIY